MQKYLFIFATILIAGCATNNAHHEHHSPYIADKDNHIPALSPADIEGLESGVGTPFGGMAKPAELNGYPGPRHVLDIAESLSLTKTQQAKIQSLFEEMRDEAIVIGKKIINEERNLNQQFINKTITLESLQHKTNEIAALRGALRAVHLKHHLYVTDILTPEQIANYNHLRGYTTGDICNNIPKGHSAALWKLHHGCE